MTVETVTDLVMLQLADQEAHDTILEKLREAVARPIANGPSVFGWPASETVTYICQSVSRSAQPVLGSFAGFDRPVQLSFQRNQMDAGLYLDSLAGNCIAIQSSQATLFTSPTC
jgi:hypothetical protein